MVTTSASRRYTDYALRSLFRSTKFGRDDLVYVIDNDGSYSLPPDLIHSNLRVITNKVPLGFAENMNQLIPVAVQASADLYLLNNDIIFTRDWVRPLREAGCAVVVPVSSNELGYDIGECSLRLGMTLDDYLGHEQTLEKVAESHRAMFEGYAKMMIVPFFAVRIPHEILRAVGKLDESFGTGGAEDYDYCLRTQLAGYSVVVAKSSFILHFGGKSSWSGVESHLETNNRETKFISRFEEKWGTPLTHVTFRNRETVIAPDSPLQQELDQGNHHLVIEVLKSAREVKIQI